ncbi:MAG: hypothetical protein BWZ03_00701 [bacterium ADurb.BinA186]|nr:MAG: hypothetical protein BWZ03_00701 [bacterium ADurb.BinA186]
MKKVCALGLIGLGVGGAYFWINREGLSRIDAPTEIKEQAFYLEKNKEGFFASKPFFGTLALENLHQLSAQEIDAQLRAAKEKVIEDNLIALLNAGTASDNKVQEAKKIFEAMALLSIEKAHRGLKKNEPGLASHFKSLEQDIIDLENLLED